MSSGFLLLSCLVVFCVAKPAAPPANTLPTDTNTNQWFASMVGAPQAAYPSAAELATGTVDESGKPQKPLVDVCALLQLSGNECAMKKASLLQTRGRVYKSKSRTSSAEADTLPSDTDTNQWFKTLISDPEAAYPTAAEVATGTVDSDGKPQKPSVDVCAFLSTQECAREKATLLESFSQIYETSGEAAKAAPAAAAPAAAAPAAGGAADALSTLTTDTQSWFSTMVQVPEAGYPTEAETASGQVNSDGSPAASPGMDLCALLEISDTKTCAKKTASLIQRFVHLHRRTSALKFAPRFVARQHKAAPAADTMPTTTDSNVWFDQMIQPPEAAYPTAAEEATGAVDATGKVKTDKPEVDVCSFLQIAQCDKNRAGAVLVQLKSVSAKLIKMAKADPTGSLETPKISDGTTTQNTDSQSIMDVLKNEPTAAEPTEAEKTTKAMKDSGIDVCSMLSKAECAKKKAALLETKIARRIVHRINR